MLICNSAGGATGLFRKRGAKFAVISSGSPSASVVSPGLIVTAASPGGNCIFQGVSNIYSPRRNGVGIAGINTAQQSKTGKSSIAQRLNALNGTSTSGLTEPTATSAWRMTWATSSGEPAKRVSLSADNSTALLSSSRRSPRSASICRAMPARVRRRRMGDKNTISEMISAPHATMPSAIRAIHGRLAAVPATSAAASQTVRQTTSSCSNPVPADSRHRRLATWRRGAATISDSMAGLEMALIFRSVFCWSAKFCVAWKAGFFRAGLSSARNPGPKVRSKNGLGTARL